MWSQLQELKGLMTERKSTRLKAYTVLSKVGYRKTCLPFMDNPTKGSEVWVTPQFWIVDKGSHPMRKTVKKSGQCPYGGGGGLPQFINFSLILPGPQITWKWTMHTDKLTTKCHICQHTWKQGGLMCGIWDWQSTIVKDLNDSQDPKHTLFCREIVFVAIYALFSDKKCPLFTRFGGGRSPKADIVCFFYRFFHMMASLNIEWKQIRQYCSMATIWVW